MGRLKKKTTTTNSVDKQEIKNKLQKKAVLQRNKHITGDSNKQLSELVDYNRPFSIFYSGVEYRRYFDGCRDEGVENFLMSFEYLTSKGAKDLSYYHELGVKIFVDSGAFTYITDPSYHNMPIEYWETHIEKYLAWAERHKDIVFAIANLDLEDLVGTDKVWEWNKKYFEPFMMRTGIPVCFIWHGVSGLDHWDKMCERYPYVGFSMASENGGRADVQECMSRLAIAEKHGALVHGMGMTSIEMLTKLPFYTVDSSVDGKSSIVIKYCGMEERISIEDFYKRYERYAVQTTPTEMRIPMALLPHSVLTVNDDLKSEWRFLKAIVKHTVKKKTLKLKVEGGKDITCTTDHSIIRIDKDGNIVETKADDLKVGDYVLGIKSYDNDQMDMPSVIVNIPKFRNTDEREDVEVEVTDEFLNFLGLWVGDGSFTTGDESVIGISCCQDEECVKVIESVASQFKCNLNIGSNGVDSNLHSVTLHRVMNELGFKGDSHTKRIPKFIYSLSERQIGEFLKGYFSADGTGSCECSTVSVELKNDLVQLLEMYGMFTSVSLNKAHTFKMNGKIYNASECYHICIRDIRSKIIFNHKIGFLQQYKNDKLAEECSKPVRMGAKRNCIPKELTISNVYKDNSGRMKWVKHNKGRLSRDFDNLFSDKVKNSDLTFLLIRNIETVNEDAEVDVYDLSVCGTERFVANGILVHNTTWKSCLRYGMYVTWTGTSVKQFRKEDWDEKVVPYFKRYEQSFDMEALYDYEESEVIKASVYAFLQAEKYLREILEPFTYWKKPKSLVQRVDVSLFPSATWFEDEVYLDIDEYAKKLNINPELRRVIDYITDCTLFCLWDLPEYQTLKEVICEQYDGEYGFIEESYDKYLNKISSDESVMLEELQDFFKAVVRGENDKLLLLDTPYSRVRKERATYVDEVDKEVVELDENEVIEELKSQGSLPEEIDDEVIFTEQLEQAIQENTSIVPLRDEKGRFTGGRVTKVTKKTLLGNTPKIMCDNCIERNSCPEFRRGYVCAFDKVFSKFDTRNPNDVVDALYEMANVSVSRLQRALVQENLDGGMITSQVSNLIDQNLRILSDLKKLESQGALEVMKRTTIRRPDGTVEETQSIENPQAGGILAQLFSQPSPLRPDVETADELSEDDLNEVDEAIIDAKVEIVEENK